MITVGEVRKWLEQFPDNTPFQVCQGSPVTPDLRQVNQKYPHLRDGYGWGYWNDWREEHRLVVLGEVG